MAEMDSHETELSRTISGAESDRRVPPVVNYARASVGLEGFLLSAADEEHNQRFINEEIDCTDFVQRRIDLGHSQCLVITKKFSVVAASAG